MEDELPELLGLFCILAQLAHVARGFFEKCKGLRVTLVSESLISLLLDFLGFLEFLFIVHDGNTVGVDGLL